MKGIGSKLAWGGLLTVVAVACIASLAWASAPQGYGPGRVALSILAGRDHVEVGTGGIWNSRDKVHIQLEPDEGWAIRKYHIDIGSGEDYMPPLTPTGNPKIGHFDYKEVFSFPYINAETCDDGHPYMRTLVLDLEEDLAFRWGTPYASMRNQGLAIFLDLVRVGDNGTVVEEKGAWVVPELVTWIVDEVEDNILVDADEVVADAFTGELVDLNALKVRNTKKGKVNKKSHKKAQKTWEVEEAEEIIAFDGGRWGWWFRYTIGHPRTGHFIDSPVAGLYVETPTYEGLTLEDAKFDYFPGEMVEIWLGTVKLGETYADHKISPLDIFNPADLEDDRVVNMARLLQSLDNDGNAGGGITIEPTAVEAFELAMDYYQLEEIDFADDLQVENIIDRTISNGNLQDPPITLTKIDKDEAQGHLGKSVSTSMFRKLVSRTPDLASAKAKLNVMGVWFPAKKANGDPATYVDENGVEQPGIPYYYYNEVELTNDDGTTTTVTDAELIRVAEEAKPLVATFCDEDPETGAHDVWGAISRDDGNTWKRKNISRMAYRSSFQCADGSDYYGHCKKPVFQVRGNKILVAWTSKFAKGGKPRYSIQTCPDEDGDGVPDAGCITCTGEGDNEKCEEDYPYDDPYVVDDFWGVSGPQRSVDYTEQGYPEVGEVPYSAVWTCRGVIVSQAEINKGGWWADKEIGEIVWFKPERLTSGRRDANQVFMGAADGAGFAIAWQEDPKGLRPGEAKGPGPGWGGATANHKTDIWYSYITWADLAKIDENFVAGGDPEHPVQIDDETGEEIEWTNRPKYLVPMTLPVRISDNDAVNTNNAELLDADGNIIAAVTPGEITFEADNLTRCVKFDGGKTITTADDPEAYLADYAVLRAAPSDHNSSMNCVNCHVPYGLDAMNGNPTQGAPIPLVVLDEVNDEYLGGFNNSDCVACHYGHIVPRDRVVAVPEALRTSDEQAKCDWCEQMANGTWKDGTQEDGIVIEAYFPYDPYPYIAPDMDETKDGSHRYITEVNTTNFPYLTQDLWSASNAINPIDSTGVYSKVNYQNEERIIAVTTDGRALDGNTSATRPNLFLQTYTKKDGSKSAWAIMAYEETKGLGSGPPEDGGGGGEGLEDGTGYDPYEAFPDNGKNAIYHSFDFTQPDLVSGGMILNLPETDDDGNVLYVVEPEYLGSNPIIDGEGNITGYDPVPNPLAGELILDWKGDPQLAYENARRPRFILQSKSSAYGGVKTDGSFKSPGNSGTVLLVLYKEGEDGAGRPTDIMMRRCVTKDPDGIILSGNPWDPKNFIPQNENDTRTVVQNVSTVKPGTTWTNPDRSESAKGDGVKVCDWTQPEECLGWKSGVNPYEDSRAHRGGIRGDFVIMGYSYCPNWAASRKAHDKYDFYIRRSFDGGATWTTDPNYTEDVVHQDYFIDPEGISGSELSEDGDDVTESTKHYIVETTYSGGGVYEPARNVSLIKNNKVSVIEPRIVPVPGTIKVAGAWTGIAEDKQDPNCFYVAYGTSTNLPDVEKAPEDLFLSFSRNRGNVFNEDTWVVNPDSDGNNAGETVSGWYRLAKGDQEQGEVQIRMTPNAERFYGVWLDEGEEGSDIMFRRMCPVEFPGNRLPAATTVEPVAEEYVIDGDGDDGSGGDGTE